MKRYALFEVPSDFFLEVDEENVNLELVKESAIYYIDADTKEELLFEIVSQMNDLDCKESWFFLYDTKEELAIVSPNF